MRLPVDPHPIPPPFRTGPSNMDFLESLPGLGTVWHVVAAAAPQNRIRNRPESKREQLLRTFDAFRSQHLTAPRFFPYAIPLPERGRSVADAAAEGGGGGDRVGVKDPRRRA